MKVKTRQEEIQSGVEGVIYSQIIMDNATKRELSTRILGYLYEQGVVIKGETIGGSHPHLSNYWTVEPLIHTEQGRGIEVNDG